MTNAINRVPHISRLLRDVGKLGKLGENNGSQRGGNTWLQKLGKSGFGWHSGFQRCDQEDLCFSIAASALRDQTRRILFRFFHTPDVHPTLTEKFHSPILKLIIFDEPTQFRPFNSRRLKILPVTDCSPEIKSQNHGNMKIAMAEGVGVYPKPARIINF